MATIKVYNECCRVMRKVGYQNWSRILKIDGQ